ncbi:MAG: flavodoxin family protein [Prolixibacteraceae bacterium]|nr:flavodoxin family protein [Prolixibacteraceae bacterium]
MKTLILFDSYFGNTEKIARAFAKAFEGDQEFAIKRNHETTPEELSNYDLLIVGSPTRGFQPTEDVAKLIKSIKPGALKNTKIAAFDTRVALESIHNKLLKGMVHLGGYAAKPIAARLCKKGATQVIEPEGFFVMDTEGPLKEGELERAEAWGLKIRELAVVN